MLTLSNMYLRICSLFGSIQSVTSAVLFMSRWISRPYCSSRAFGLRRRAAALLLSLAALLGFPKQAGRVVLDAEHFAVFEHLAADKRVAPFVELELQEVGGRDEPWRAAGAGQHQQAVPRRPDRPAESAEVCPAIVCASAARSARRRSRRT